MPAPFRRLRGVTIAGIPCKASLTGTTTASRNACQACLTGCDPPEGCEGAWPGACDYVEGSAWDRLATWVEKPQ